ncbi:MAG: tyrosine-type recombinase/integrase [Luteimonas sp.]|nr:tyrosine-type recombinase/integrase [Luteimonas sp.]
MTATILPFPGQTPSIPPSTETASPPRASRKKTVLEPLPLARAPRELTSAEQHLQTRILDGFFRGSRPSLGHEPTSILRDRNYVEELLRFVGQPLWALTPDDFESWSGHLGLVKFHSPNTQRTKQTAIAQFYAYATENVGWQNEVARQFGGRIANIVTRFNRRVHVCDQTPSRERKYLVATDFDALFDLMACVVEVAAQETPRQLKTFQRDRAMFYTYYAFGLRLDEGHQLNLHSFSPNPDLPELGRWGVVGVLGKGSRGSGKRYREVTTLQADLPGLLDWYVDEVRPSFPRLDPQEPAMWLSEQGRRLCRASIAQRYKTLLAACGQDERLFSPHGLRHMWVSHQACANVPTLFTSHSAGHSSSAVTARYTHLPDDFLRSVAYNLVRSALTKPKKSEQERTS